MKTNWIGGFLFSAVLIGTAPAQVGVYSSSTGGRLYRRRSAAIASRAARGDAGSRIFLGGQVLGSERGTGIAGWEGAGIARRMRASIGATPLRSLPKRQAVA
jgi:hypothetical protein